jgi:hypothetical protein
MIGGKRDRTMFRRPRTMETLHTSFDVEILGFFKEWDDASSKLTICERNGRKAECEAARIALSALESAVLIGANRSSISKRKLL